MEADFQREYRLDLAAACYGPDAVGVRRLLSLIAGLSPGSAVGRAENADWTTDRELAAAQVEMTHEVVRAVLAVVASLSKKQKVPDPLRIPRPTPERREPARPKRASPAEMRAFFPAPKSSRRRPRG